MSRKPNQISDRYLERAREWWRDLNDYCELPERHAEKSEIAMQEFDGHNLETVFYCKCGQAVRYRKRDGVWVHYGYKRMHEPYFMYLARCNHPVEIADCRIWSGSLPA